MADQLDLYRVVMPSAVAGIVVDRTGIVTHGAPILRRFLGWPVVEVIQYSERRGWQIERIDPVSSFQTRL